MNYYELIYLSQDLKELLSGSHFVLATTRFKNVIEFFIESKNEINKLVFSTSPGNIALFYNRQASAAKKNRMRFFEAVYNRPVQDVVLAKNDRIIEILFENEDRLVLVLFGSRANVFFASGGRIVESFKGEPGNLSLPESRVFTPPEINEHMQADEMLVRLNPQLPRKHLRELTEVHSLGAAAPSQIEQFAARLDESLRQEPEFRILTDGSRTLFNEQLLPLETGKKFDTISELIEYEYVQHERTSHFRRKKNSYLKEIDTRLRRTESSLKNLSKAVKNPERAALYEKYGHLLMAHAHLGKTEKPEFVTEDLYEQGKTISIPVNPKLNLAENAGNYYRKAGIAESSYREAKKQIPVHERQKATLLSLKESLEEIYDSRSLRTWEKENKTGVAELGQNKQKQMQKDSVPFHTFEVEGYAVWIGKNARNNDLLVRRAHKEDVWLHARGVPGSHVLIRMGNTKTMPPKHIIQKAAAYAAFNSKAAGAELVPVIFTKSKYVRKPRKAAPGAVVAEREQVVFVHPENPEK